MKKIIINLFITLLFMGGYYYLVLPPINLQSGSFYTFLIMGAIFYLVISSFSMISTVATKSITGSYKNYDDIRELKNLSKSSKYILLSILGVFIVIIVVNFINSPLFNSNAYANRIVINETNDFTTDIAEVDFNKIPLLDKESTSKLGDRTMGEIPEFVSQFSVSNLYTQIEYNEEIIRVTPLEYADIFKYFSNKDEGVKGYITVNSVDGTSSLNELDKGMKYMPSAYFSEDLDRKLRFSYPTLIFGEKTFELDEEGNPYWIVPILDYVGVGLRTEISGIIVLDAVTGDSKKYELDEVPSWVDHVYSSNLIIEQVDNWGSYVNGFWNSIFGQKDVVNTTDGYTYLTINDDVYLYTGITSVAADEANLGFLLVNLRTKEANYYPVAGAEEYSAMRSAEGLVQEKGYTATFPLLINLSGRPTYLLSLKDAAGLVKMYAFVDVVDYQIVSTTDSSLGIEAASKEYLTKIGEESVTQIETLEKEIIIDSIVSAVIDGTTIYYITDEDNNKYQLSVKVDELYVPFIKKGDTLNIKYTESDINIIKDIINE